MNKYDVSYMKMACIWAENSYAKRNKVGVLVVKDNMIISDGYNGTVSGSDNACEDSDGNTKWNVLHAELNAITKLAKSHTSSIGATIYTTLSPCRSCACLIIQSNFKRVVYLD